MGLTRKADIVFCLDISGSMQPCINAVKAQIDAFVASFAASPQISWDLRLGLLAHRATIDPRDKAVVVGTTLLHTDSGGGPLKTIYKGSDKLFTNDTSVFRKKLAELEANGDEAMLFALDCALDFPWRDAGSCHRVAVMMTDEPIEDGLLLTESRGVIEELIRKIMNLRIMLFVVGPDSELLEQLSMVDRSEWELVKGYDGLREVDFRKLLQSIARSISVSSFGLQASTNVKKALFGQDDWGTTHGVEFKGR
jgi:hypothetical protein